MHALPRGGDPVTAALVLGAWGLVLVGLGVGGWGADRRARRRAAEAHVAALVAEAHAQIARMGEAMVPAFRQVTLAAAEATRAFAALGDALARAFREDDR